MERESILAIIYLKYFGRIKVAFTSYNYDDATQAKYSTNKLS